MTHVAPRIVNNVSFVTRINHEIHFSWQAQSLVTRIGNNVSCVKRINDECYFSWQPQYLVKFKCHFRGRRSIR